MQAQIWALILKRLGRIFKAAGHIGDNKKNAVNALSEQLLSMKSQPQNQGLGSMLPGNALGGQPQPTGPQRASQPQPTAAPQITQQATAPKPYGPQPQATSLAPSVRYGPKEIEEFLQMLIQQKGGF